MPRVAPKAGTALLIFLLGVCLTFASLRYVKPAKCHQLCLNEPCALGACKPGEQIAGFPFPFVRDQESHVGSSPTSAWGRVGLEDYTSADIKAFSFNILFYSAIVGSLTRLGKSLRTRL
jgi:hypothetical protein